MKKNVPKTVDEYIRQQPKAVQVTLRKMRTVIRKAAPAAAEGISYRMPAYRLGEVLVYFAAFSGHISLFPTSSGVARFRKELAAYETSKGTIQFPLDRPIPYGLISRIVKFRAKEAAQKEKKKPRK